MRSVVKSTVVRYRTRAERAEENQRLVEAVFDDLRGRAPNGFSYQVQRLDDGVSFLHVVVEDDIPGSDSLQDVPAFQAFLAGIAERCEEPPVAKGATLVGRYPG
jgi:hypothetical protein